MRLNKVFACERGKINSLNGEYGQCEKIVWRIVWKKVKRMSIF